MDLTAFLGGEQAQEGLASPHFVVFGPPGRRITNLSASAQEVEETAARAAHWSAAAGRGKAGCARGGWAGKGNRARIVVGGDGESESDAQDGLFG